MDNGIIYKVSDKPSWGKTFTFALQQLLAILAATIAVPQAVGHGMSQSAALFGAGIGTLVYVIITKFKSPVFLGSSFTFVESMAAAFAGGVSMSVGYLGLIIGAVLAGAVYVIISLIVWKCGSEWVSKVMPAVVIGPIVSLIGLSLAPNAVSNLLSGAGSSSSGFDMNLKGWLSLICGLVTLCVTVACSIYGKKMLKMIPFILGILSGYLLATIFTLIGIWSDADSLRIISWAGFKDMQWYPDFTFVKAFKGHYDFAGGNFFSYFGTICVAYIPVGVVSFAEHIADHKNLSSIIGDDLLKDPGLNRTVMGDGVGSMVGAFFGGCANTTYGESVGCVAISGNASIRTIVVTACLAMVCSFIAPFTTFIASIPNCVMGGVCIALYGFIAVSGLKMLQQVDLSDNKNMFVVSAILITGVGGMILRIGKVVLTDVACALIVGIMINVLVNIKRKEKNADKNENNEIIDNKNTENDNINE